MRRQLSLGMLFARSSLWRVLGILLLMAAGQVLLARLTLYDGLTWMVPEQVFDGGWFRLISALGLTGVAAVGMRAAGGSGSRCDYAVSRLPVPRWTVYVWSVGCILGLLLLFWVVELAVMLGILRWYAAEAPFGPNNPQLILLASYRCGLLHTLLPLRDGFRLGATIAYFVGLGTVSGVWAVRGFGGKWSVVPLVLAMAWWFNAGGVGSVGWALFLAVSALALAFGAAYGDREELS